MRRPKGITLLLIIATALGATGCGDDDSDRTDEDQVREVAQGYVDAVAARDAVTACRYLPEEPACVERTREEFTKGEPLGSDFGKVKAVRIEGDIARADFSGGGFFALSKSEGDWKIGAPADEATKVGAPEPPETPSVEPPSSKKEIGGIVRHLTGKTLIANCGNTYYLEYKPKRWSHGCTGGANNLYRAEWIEWTDTAARGRGTARLRVCEPSCAEASSYVAPARLNLSRPRPCDDGRGKTWTYFSRVRYSVRYRADNPFGFEAGWRTVEQQPQIFKNECSLRVQGPARG